MAQADELLRSIKKVEAKAGQGKLKIFMGMVAGVGKTYAMLKAAHALKESGQEPVIGYVETHGRQETESLLKGLPLIARKKIPYKDVELEEFDIDACLELRPQLVLIDELAHTNVPGSRHEKRWQDVLEIINNGIDVYTTLNVQHVESRAETISSITNIRIFELVPDSVIDRADEIVLIDLIPDEILVRLKQGKIYAQEKVDSATQNFFKVSNLTALREISLRLMAERVDHELKDLSLMQGISHITTHHKMMVAIFGSPYSESLIRYTRKLAYGLNCKWFACYVSNRLITEAENELLNKNIELVKQLGGEVFTTQNESVVEGLLHIAHQQSASQIIVGNTEPKGFFRFIWRRKTLPEALIKYAKGIDINVISPHEKRAVKKSPKLHRSKDFELDWRSLLTTTGYMANITFFNAIVLPIIPYRAVGIIYLMGITIGSLFIKSYNIYIAAVLGGVCWNIFFIPPRFTVHVQAAEDWMLLALYIVAGFVIGNFTKRLQEKEDILRNEGNRAAQLYSITKDLSNSDDIDSLVKTVKDQIDILFGCESTIFIRPWNEKDYDPSISDGRGSFIVPGKEEYALQWVIKNKQPAGRFTDTLPSSLGYYIPLISDKKIVGILVINVSSLTLLNHDGKLLVDAIARQLAVGIARENLELELRGKLVSEESERIYKTLLNSVSHEMRTPLAAIKGFASALNQFDLGEKNAQIKEIGAEISYGVERLDYVVQNLLDMSRLESGNLKLNLDYIDIKEMIETAIEKVKNHYGQKEFKLKIEKDFPLVYLDYFLMEQSIENILRNAFLYTSRDKAVDIEVKINETTVMIDITDYGEGIKNNDPEVVFKKFYRESPKEAGGLGLGLSICKAVIELHHGTISVMNVPNKGASFQIRLPRELDRELINYGRTST